MNKTHKLLKPYDYNLPKSLIALSPAKPRDTARLLIYDRKRRKIFSDRFYNLDKYLLKNSVLIFNQTRVIPARLKLMKNTGGKVEILYLGQDVKRKVIKALANRRLTTNSILFLSPFYDGRHKTGIFKIIKKTENAYWLKYPGTTGKLKKILQKHGLTPLPPYLKKSRLDETARRRDYQSIFAKTGESIAAPTASLHFTKGLMKKLSQKGIALKFINLNVNLGTFGALTEKQIKDGKLHTETFSINLPTLRYIKRAKKQRRPIIAVGTTVARALESAFQNPGSIKLQGSTDLFIRPPYKFKIVDALITNFHVPKSSLMLLVAALTGRKRLLALYKRAIKNRFRFFSFGDGMLIL